jgi:DNA-binding CsgD family transcriptional regulator
MTSTTGAGVLSAVERDRFLLERDGDTVTEAGIDTIYRDIVASTAPSRTLLIAHGHAPGAVDRAIQILHWRELIDATDPEVIDVVPPDIALPTFATSLERQARAVRHDVATLAHAFRAARSELDVPGSTAHVRSLHSVEEITAVAQRIEANVQTSLLAMLAGGPRLELLVAGAHEQVEVAEDHGDIERVVVVNSSAFDVPGAAEDFMSRAGVGYDLRVAHDLPFNALIVDGQAAVIDCTNLDETGAGSLFIQDPVLVRAIDQLIRRIHHHAAPLRAAPALDPADASARDRLILTLLAAGTSDAVIARQARVSQRTVQRSISVLMEQLDAATRFQAGVNAVRAGLI